MNRLLLATHVIAASAVVLPQDQAQAFFHLWTFTEFFSSPDGSVQFIELRTTGSGETAAQGATITSTSTGKVYTMPTNLTFPTTNKSLLIATAGFGALPGGVTPDFPTVPLEPNFFNPAGDTITLVQSFQIDSKMFTSVPTDGVKSLNYFPVNGEATNSPTNFAGGTGSVDLSAPSPTGDYNGNGSVDAADYILWRDTLDQTVSPNGSGADGSGNGTIDAADYEYWSARFGNTIPGSGSNLASASVPEPAAAATLIGAMLALWTVRRTR